MAMKRILLIYLCLMVVAPAAARERGDSLSVAERVWCADDALSEIGEGVYSSSVSASAYRRKVSLSSLALRYDMRSEQEAMLQAEGDGLNMGSFAANSYMHLDRHSTVEASASFFRGSKRNVSWNSSSDYRLLWPYIAADSVGGDLTSEQYSFGGSYARRGERFTYGVGASYRALHEFRRVDPRPRNITSDLNLQISGGYNFQKYYLGATANVRVYSQDHSVDYFNMAGANTNQLPMTGLGTYYDRFVGSSSDYTNYEFDGVGYSASVQFVPKDGDGWRASVGYNSFIVKRLLPQINNIPLTRLLVDEFSAEVAYRSQSGSVRWAVGGEFGYEVRRGEENLLNTGSLSSNMILATFTMYECHTAQAALTGGVEFMRDWGYWFVRPRAELLSVDAGYRYPERRMEFMTVDGALDIGMRYRTELWLLDAMVGGGYVAGFNHALFLPANAEAKLRELVTRQCENFSSDRVQLNARVMVQRAVNERLAVYLSAAWQMYNRESITGHRAYLEVGIKF